MVAICGKRKISFKFPRVHLLDTLSVENFNEIALSRTVKEILCFAIFGKNSKWPPFFFVGGSFLKIANSTLVRYPVDRKFRRNHSNG